MSSVNICEVQELWRKIIEDRPWLEVSDSVLKFVLSTHNTLKFCPQHQAMAFFEKAGKVELVNKALQTVSEVATRNMNVELWDDAKEHML